MSHTGPRPHPSGSPYRAKARSRNAVIGARPRQVADTFSTVSPQGMTRARMNVMIKTRITRTQTVMAMTPTTTLMMTMTTLVTPTTKLKLMTKHHRPRQTGDMATTRKTSTGAWFVAV